MECPVDYFQEKICYFFLQHNAECKYFKRENITLIKTHAEKLKEFGDLSFSVNKEIWLKYFLGKEVTIKSDAFERFLKKADGNIKTEVDDFLRFASEWIYPVANLKVESERCLLYLDRKATTCALINQVLENPKKFGQLKKDAKRLVRINTKCLSEDSSDLSGYRSNLIESILKKILEYSYFTIITESDSVKSNILDIKVQSVAERSANESIDSSDNCVIIKCGLVVDPKTKKSSTMTTQEYQKLRSNELHLIALHKYGIRVKDDGNFIGLIKRLGDSVVKVDLLEVKHSSPVQIILNGQGSTKGASFILYNSARLESLLRAFEERVKSGVYGQLPEILDVDFSLLMEEEEWQLVFGCIMEFPNVIERCVRQLEKGLVATHLIIRYLNSFVSVFSCYYRRIRIMTEHREHLMPYVYARIYLIRAVREVLNNTLALFDIKPVMFM